MEPDNNNNSNYNNPSNNESNYNENENENENENYSDMNNLNNENNENAEANDNELENEDDEANPENEDNFNQSFDEDEDFPQYANRINKKLNAIIKNYKSEIKNCQNEINENLGMVKVLEEHSKSVETQVKNKQMILDHTREQIKLEEHMKQTTNRQIGKLNTQIITLEDQETELQERLNSIQHNIYKANEKMDKYKIEMKFKQDEL